MTGPATTSTTTRPPPGPARGSIAAPTWVVASLATALVLVAAYALWRAYGRRRR